MSKQIMVFKRTNNKTADTPEWLHTNDINIVKTETKSGKSQTVFYTDNGEYVYCTGTEPIIYLLNSDNFIQTDRGMMARLNEKTEINHNEKKIYLERDHSVFVTVTVAKYKLIKKYLSELLK
ncbi:LytTR family transcriptional regulator DNA-binding domain-containing protein [Paenibacillus sp. FSL H3-0286]|uniref:LytTR family transcriptional regulator DNA-binding domain-containing protein n=1 Tax=Paenibacillus sp. FSL H3-0286 TaxID=2921427 RepID=UPI0032490197